MVRMSRQSKQQGKRMEKGFKVSPALCFSIEGSLYSATRRLGVSAHLEKDYINTSTRLASPALYRDATRLVPLAAMAALDEPRWPKMPPPSSIDLMCSSLEGEAGADLVCSLAEALGIERCAEAERDARTEFDVVGERCDAAFVDLGLNRRCRLAGYLRWKVKRLILD
jgi:hypothetical protein